MPSNCVFCKIAQGKDNAYIIWEDDNYVAFLSTHPNTSGATVVIPKKHLSSDIFEQSSKEIAGIMLASQQVADLLKASFKDVGRVGLVFEGFEVNHLHAKLYPLHGTKSVTWRRRISRVDKYFNQYEGYISSHEYKKIPAEDLKQLQEIITKNNK